MSDRFARPDRPPLRPPDERGPGDGLSYADAIAALSGRGRFGIHLGLGRTRALLRALGDPQVRVRGALIAGTNGKGSVQALAAAMLRAAGYRVGQAPKPHLVEYRERIVVEGAPIAPDEMGRLVARTLVAADRVARRLGPPTEFEVLTAAAFAWFAACDVDVAVVEVGLGGRLDATNAWDGGVAAVTNVALDHADLLGATIPQIAREKAAILKRGDLGVTGATGEALDVVRRRARRMGVPLTETAPLQVLGMDRHGLHVAVPGLGAVRLGLLGRHQAANAAVALGVVDALEAAGIARVPWHARREGLEAARWPGRLELVALPTLGPPLDLLLDGAHNPAGVRALLDALEELRPSLAPGPATLILAIMRDKDVAGMVGQLASASPLRGGRVVVTQVTPRGMAPADLAAAWQAARPGSAISLAGGAEEALEMGIRHAARAGGPLVVAGSLYLVGAVRGLLVSRGLLR